jgi:molecular chaperone Hsp33
VVRALVALGPQELHNMMTEEQGIQVRCEFCATDYAFSRQELMDLLDTLSR